MSSNESPPSPADHHPPPHEQHSQPPSLSSPWSGLEGNLTGAWVERSKVQFRVHLPARKRMVCMGRGSAQMSVSVAAERDVSTGLPRMVRQVCGIRRVLAFTQRKSDIRNRNISGHLEGESEQNEDSVVTGFVFANSIQRPLAMRFSKERKEDLEDDGSETGEPSLVDLPEITITNEAGDTVKLHLRGGCLSMPKRKGSKRRLEDDEQLPTLIWWAAGGRPHTKPPTGRQLREWKRRSHGYHQGRARRGWVKEFVFVMSSGRMGRNTGKPESGDSLDNPGDVSSSHEDIIDGANASKKAMTAQELGMMEAAVVVRRMV